MEYSLSYFLGVAVGILSVAVVCFIVAKVVKKTSKDKDAPLLSLEFDERQLRVRSDAFKSAFLTLCFYLALVGLYNSVTGNLFGTFTVISFLGIFISLIVFAIICIRRDAYLSIK
ncbi:MAG: hypothetical protein Q4C00_06695, partial [Bacillota bacterium]|nr:hypothetical protein [Bacillota bacterium]